MKIMHKLIFCGFKGLFVYFFFMCLLLLQGFGDVFGEHWLGNEALHLLTSQGQYSLRVELKDWEGNPAHSQYDRFTLANERLQYR